MRGWLTLTICLFASANGLGKTIYVATDGNDANNGVAGAPVQTIQAGIDIADPGDTVSIGPGVYPQTLRTKRGGLAGMPITIQGEQPGTVTVTAQYNTLLTVAHPHIHVRQLIFDGQFAAHDLVRVFSTGDYFRFQHNLVRNGRKDGIDLGNAATLVDANFDYLVGVSITESEFKNFLNKDIFGHRIDAHGIVAGGVIDFEISNTAVAMVSGDALQLANGNWDNVLVDSVQFHNGLIDEQLAEQTGFAVGINPGENAIDTKQDRSLPVRSRLKVVNSKFSGWRGDLINNAAALNLKEQVSVQINACEFMNNEIALRLRGSGAANVGAHIVAPNNVFYRNEKALRVEDELRESRVINNTFGDGQVFEFVSGGGAADFFAANNLLSLATLPAEFPANLNLRVTNESFVDADEGDFSLSSSSPAIDSALTLNEVTSDHHGLARPQGDAFDFGAYEFKPRVVAMPIPGWLEVLGLGCIMLKCAKSNSVGLVSGG